MSSGAENATPAKDAMDTAPARCAAGCGFFGNSATGGMCSKCYKEAVAKGTAAAPAAPKPEPAAPKPEPAAASSASPAPPAPAAAAVTPAAAPAVTPTAAAAASSTPICPPVPSPAVAASPAVADEEGSSEEPPKKVQANTSRCWTCNRKIGLLGFQCKCEYYYCSEHRYSDRHECAFDYKAQGKQLLTKANPTIAPSKLDTI